MTAVGYGSVFSPPERQNNRSRVVIDWSRLMSQIGAVLFLAWAVQTLYSSAAEGEKEKGGVPRA